MSRLHDVRKISTQDDALLDSAQGVQSGSGIFKADLIGFQIDPPQNTLVTIGMSSLYLYNPTPAALSVVSTSASDSSAGTGVRTILVAVRDSVTKLYSFVPITMNGTTPVTVAGSWDACAPGIFHALTVGSNKTAVGTITATISGQFQSNILPGRNQCDIIAGAFPINQKGFIFNIQCSSINDCDFHLVNRDVASSVDAAFIDQWAGQAGGAGGTVPFSARRGAILQPSLGESEVRILSRNANNRIFVYFETFVVLNSSL